MRKILFRGKRVDTGEWLYGYFEIDFNKSLIVINGYCFFVYLETVGQFTGLNDKNGNKIFEGDIFIDTDYPDTVYQVDYVDGAFVAKERTTNEQIFLRDFVVFGEPEVETIGNIYDNPELLEV